MVSLLPLFTSTTRAHRDPFVHSLPSERTLALTMQPLCLASKNWSSDKFTANISVAMTVLSALANFLTKLLTILFLSTVNALPNLTDPTRIALFKSKPPLIVEDCYHQRPLANLGLIRL